MTTYHNRYTYQLSEIELVAQQLVEAYHPYSRFWIFEGEMGAGKTTLIKAICKALGVEQTVSSPTFAIVNEYQATGGLVYHFDFYRLKTETEAFDFGYEEYFYSGEWCFIEWASKIPNLLPSNYVKISIKTIADSEREVTINH